MEVKNKSFPKKNIQNHSNIIVYSNYDFKLIEWKNAISLLFCFSYIESKKKKTHVFFSLLYIVCSYFGNKRREVKKTSCYVHN